MAFDLVAAGGYGSGELGDVTNPTGSICTTAFWYNYVDHGEFNYEFTIRDKQVGIYGDFDEGMEVLITFGGMSEDDTEYADDVGLWCIASISSVEGNRITLGDFDNTAFYKIVSASTNPSMAQPTISITSIPHFKNLTLNAGCSLSPREGFPLAFKCSDTLTLNGGHINLTGKGGDRRPYTQQEKEGKLDTDKYSGWENSQTKYRFILNGVDGAAFILVNKLVVANSSSRIGNPNVTGVQFCRGVSDSRNLPNNVTNISGSTILLVAGTITDFVPDIIAKYRPPSSGEDLYYVYDLARCYIASNTILRNDEGLYAYDNISDSSRVSTSLNVKTFGNGEDGASSLTTQINNYCKVTAIDSTRKVLTVTGKTTAGAAPFKIGALVMVHFNHTSAQYCGQSGRFILAKILGINGDDITIDTAVPNAMNDNFANYSCQLVTIPQFSSYTLSETNSATPAYDGNKGGIFAIAVKGTCDLSGGKINVEGKGGGEAYGRNGLAVIGNAQNANKLPIGQGHGSVFILAKNLIMNSATRIGATYSGAKQGGFANSDTNTQSGYRGQPFNSADNVKTNGWGGGYGEDTNNGVTQYGGYGSSALLTSNDGSTTRKGEQGAHIMIIADKITGLNQAAISTGGDGSNGILGDTYAKGGAGYGGAGSGGGGGGYNGGGALNVIYIDSGTNKGGGSSGWAFIYCNKNDGQDSTYTVYI